MEWRVVCKNIPFQIYFIAHVTPTIIDTNLAYFYLKEVFSLLIIKKKPNIFLTNSAFDLLYSIIPMVINYVSNSSIYLIKIKYLHKHAVYNTCKPTSNVGISYW